MPMPLAVLCHCSSLLSSPIYCILTLNCELCCQGLLLSSCPLLRSAQVPSFSRQLSSTRSSTYSRLAAYAIALSHSLTHIHTRFLSFYPPFLTLSRTFSLSLSLSTQFCSKGSIDVDVISRISLFFAHLLSLAIYPFTISCFSFTMQIEYQRILVKMNSREWHDPLCPCQAICPTLMRYKSVYSAVKAQHTSKQQLFDLIATNGHKTAKSILAAQKNQNNIGNENKFKMLSFSTCYY